MRISRNLPVPPPQPSAPSAELFAIRKSWKWAYLSHFLFTYNPMLHLEDIALSELEDDIAGGTFEVIPTVMQRLLTSLTPHDKRMILENWQHQLRKQSLKRAGDHNLMGTEDEPVNFSSLIMSDKLDVLQSLCEWQFHSPNNLRSRMKDDDDYANWRIEPIAYDAKGNAYWLMGGNRLWIQYAPPRKQAARSHKRKHPAAPTTNGRKSAKRGSAMTASSSKTANSKAAKSNSKAVTTSTHTGRPMRSTRTSAAAAGSSSAQRPRTVGTRVSTRLRGKEEEEVWQPIPEEWLKEESSEDAAQVPLEDQLSNGKGKGKEMDVKAKAESTFQALDDVSELTSLSDLSDIQEDEEEEEEKEKEEEEEEEEEASPIPTPDFSSSSESWETVCTTLAEWEAFPQRFETSTHRGEKAFYKLLTNDIVPMVTEVLRTDVRKKHMEEAIVTRKRSSRIAVKESVREAERAETRRKADEEKELERHKRWEARARKEEEERLRRETARSARLRERAGGRSESMDVDVDVVGGMSENKPKTTNGITLDASAPAATPVKFIVNATKSGTQTPKDDEPWELDCEVCRKRGMNLDEGQELMCCERCNKWQHIRCHDQADFIAGRPRRNWELVDFLCTACVAKDRAVQQSTSLQGQQLGYQPHSQAWVQYNGSALLNGAVPLQHYQLPPAHKTTVPTKSSFQRQPAYEAPVHVNGRTSYTVPQTQAQQPYSIPGTAQAQTQYVQRHQPTGTPTANRGYPTSSPSQTHTPTSVPYTSTPNMYLSNYSNNYRPAQNAHNATVLPQQQQSVAHYPVAQGQSTLTSNHTSGWPQQQTHYNQPTTQQAWNSSGNSSVPPYARGAARPPQAYVQQQQNGYYRSHPAAPPSAHAQPPHLSTTQPYYTGGPTS